MNGMVIEDTQQKEMNTYLSGDGKKERKTQNDIWPGQDDDDVYLI